MACWVAVKPLQVKPKPKGFAPRLFLEFVSKKSMGTATLPAGLDGGAVCWYVYIFLEIVFSMIYPYRKT